MSGYKVLVDSSVWIDYFKSGNIDLLDKLLDEDLVCTNDLILSELIPTLLLQNRKEVIDSLNVLENISLRIDWKIIQHYQFLNLKNGVNKVGIPDLIILQQVIDRKITLLSFDKHFRLMNAFLVFELINSNF